MASSVGDLLERPHTAQLMERALTILFGAIEEGGGSDVFESEGLRRIADSYPVDRLFGYPELPFDRAELAEAIRKSNASLGRTRRFEVVPATDAIVLPTEPPES